MKTLKKNAPPGTTLKKKSLVARLGVDIWKNRYNLILIVPVLIWLFLFSYKPMYGVLIAFKKFRPGKTIMECDWVGLKYFIQFLSDPYFMRTLRNTLVLSCLSLVIAFPVPIIFALILNEVRAKWFKRTVQTITYMPHFISLVVICGLLTAFCQTDGLFNTIIEFFGGERSNLLMKKELYLPIYILSDIWQGTGWASILYLSALSGIDQSQYEAATLDGANRFQQMLHVTLPGIMPVISIQLILRVGSLLSVGYEKSLLLYQPLTYEVADIISTYTYRRGLIDGDFSYATAVGLFNSAINILLLIIANKSAKKAGQSGFF